MTEDTLSRYCMMDLNTKTRWQSKFLDHKAIPAIDTQIFPNQKAVRFV